MRSILLIGFGAIGRHVARLLAPERAAGTITLTALVTDLAKHADHLDLGAEVVDLGAEAAAPNARASPPGASIAETEHARFLELLERTDVVVECAGVPAAARLGPAVIAAGLPLVLTSVGTLADSDARRGLLAGPGRLHVTNGAIGGLDVLEAAAQANALDSVEITTSKEATGLIRPWMSTPEVHNLQNLRPADGPLTVFTGHPAEAIEKFPANVNVAVALAWATRGLSSELSGLSRGTDGVSRGTGGLSRATGQAADTRAGQAEDDDALMEASLHRVHVTIRAIAGQTDSAHLIEASGAAGEFSFTIRSTPSPENPATSGLTALSLTRSLRSVLAAA